MHRLLGRATLPVHGDAGHRLGQARGQPGRAGDVARLRADRVHAAEHHVVDCSRVRLRAGQQGGDDVRAEIGRVRCRQAAPTHLPSPLHPGDRGAHGVDNEGLGHRRLPVLTF